MKSINVNIPAKTVVEVMLQTTEVGGLDPRNYSIKPLGLGEQVVVGVGALSDILGTPNECSDTVNGADGVALTSEVVRGVKMGFNQLICPSILENTLGEVFLQPTTSIAGNPQMGGVMLDILRQQFGLALSNDLVRAAWLGNLNFTTSKTLGLMNGYLAQYQNSGRSTSAVVGTGDFASGDALGTLKKLVMDANIKLRNTPNNMKRIFVSDAILRNYRQDLIAAGLENAGNITYTQDGLETVRYNGIELIVMPSWDLEYAKSGNVFGLTIPDGELRLAVYAHVDALRFYVAQNDALREGGQPVTNFSIRYLDETEQYRVKANILANAKVANFDYVYSTVIPVD